MTGVTGGEGTASPSGYMSSSRFLVGFVLLDVLFSMHCFVDRSSFVILLFLPLCCLSSFNLRIIIIPSNSSYNTEAGHYETCDLTSVVIDVYLLLLFISIQLYASCQVVSASALI